MESDEQQKQWRSLVQLRDANKLFSPLSNSLKIKYTCIAASSNHVILGANSGGIYCFTADEFKFTRLLANKEGSISLLKFSPVDHTLAVVAGGNNVCFWEHNLDTGNEAKRFHVSTALRDCTITDMVWDARGTRMFYGDNLGRIAIAYVPKLSKVFGSSSLFKKVDEVIHSEKVPIVQLDAWKEYMLVSTAQRCCLIKLQGEIIESVTQVGTKPREGIYGGLFHPRWEGHHPVIYSSRPRSRLWEANIEGRVVTTIRNGGVIIPPSFVIDIEAAVLPEAALSVSSSKSFNFHFLALLSDIFLVTWERNNLYIFHTTSYSLSNWLTDFNDIANVVCVNDTIYILYNNCQSIKCIHYMTMGELLTSITHVANWSLAEQVLIHYTDVIRDEIMMTNQIVIDTVAAVLCSINETRRKELTSNAGLQELVSLIESKGITVFGRMENNELDGVEETDSGLPSNQLTEEPLNVGYSVIEEDNQFVLEGGVDVSTIEEATSINSVSPTLSPNETSSKPQPINFFRNSLTETNSSPSSVGMSPLAEPPPPLMTRMGSVEGTTEEDDVVAVRSRDKKRRGSKSKKRKDSKSSVLPASQPNLEDISELDYPPLLAEISPAQSQLSSTATSLDNSPHTSLPPSPKLDTHTSLDTSSTDRKSPTATNEGKPFRSQSMNIIKEEPLLVRSQSLNTDGEFQAKQKPSGGLLVRVKSMASSQDGSIQRTGRFMKEILSSISPTPIAAAESCDLAESSSEIGECPTSGSATESKVLPVMKHDEQTLKFINAINIAKSSLESPQTICSPELMSQSLLDWREELHHFHTHLESLQDPSSTNEVFNHSCYMSIDDTLRSLATDLTTTSLELEIHRHDESVIDFISNYQKVLNVTRVKRFLSGRPLATMCKGLRALAVTKGYDTLTAKSSDIQETLKLTPEHSMSIIAKLYNEKIDVFLSFCVNNYPLIEPSEVAAVCKLDCIGTSRNDDDVDKPDLVTYLSYLDKLFMEKNSVHTSFANVELLTHSLIALLSYPPDLSTTNENGLPIANSHLVEWPHQTGLTGLTSLCCECEMDDVNLKQICEMFKKKGYWKGYLQICLVLKHTDKVIQTLSCLKNISLLQEITAKGSVFTTSMDWQKFVDHSISLGDVPIECDINNDTMMSWEGIVREMVKSIGVEQVGEILKTIDLSCSLPSGLHQLLIDATCIHKEQRAIAHNLLEKLDRYLWLTRPVNLGPVLSAVCQKEEEEIKLKKEEGGIDDRVPPHDIASPPPELYLDNIGQSYMEDGACHWGIKSNTTKCAVCGQVISRKVSDKGLIAFQCGHIFHQHCIPELACIVCFMKNYKSHLLATIHRL